MRNTVALFFALLLVCSNHAFAGEKSEQLSKCLVESTTQADRTALIRWIFGAVTQHPAVSDMTKLDPKEWQNISKNAAGVFQKLIADKCASQSREALLTDGMEGYKSAFATLGQTAMTGLMDDPSVNKSIADLDKYLDPEKLFKAVMTGTSQEK